MKDYLQVKHSWVLFYNNYVLENNKLDFKGMKSYEIFKTF